MAVIKLESKDFKAEVLEAKGKVLVDFYADWCGPCRMMGPVFEELSNEKENVKFCKINVDESGEIAQQYGVMSIPTFIVFEDGQIVNKMIGGRSKDELAKSVE